MNEKIDLRIRKTKKALYDALLTLMSSNQLEAIKVSDICEKAQINRTTFYAHFEDKYDLLQNFIYDLKIEINNELSKNKNIITPRQHYIELIRLLLSYMNKNKSKYTAIFVTSKNSIALDMLYNVIISDINEHIENNIDNVPKEIVSKFYLGGVFSVTMEWLNSKDKYSIDDIINYLELLLPGK